MSLLTLLRHIEPLLPHDPVTHTGAANLTGTGSLTATGTRTVIGVAALTGTGSLEATGTVDAGTVPAPSVGGGRLVWVPEPALPRRAARVVTAEAHLTGRGWLTADADTPIGMSGLTFEDELTILLSI